jgi:uncharacterized protein with HEPN domain
MTRDQQRLADYLHHILEAIERIAQYTEDMDEPAFLNSPLVQDAVIRNVEIIGEASNNIEKRYPEFALKLGRPVNQDLVMGTAMAWEYL